MLHRTRCSLFVGLAVLLWVAIAMPLSVLSQDGEMEDSIVENDDDGDDDDDTCKEKFGISFEKDGLGGKLRRGAYVHERMPFKNGVMFKAKRTGDDHYSAGAISTTKRIAGSKTLRGMQSGQKALMISEMNKKTAGVGQAPDMLGDEDALVGQIVATFDKPLKLKSLTYLGVKEAGGSVQVFNSNGILLLEKNLQLCKEGEIRKMKINTNNVKSMIMNVGPGGAAIGKMKMRSRCDDDEENEEKDVEGGTLFSDAVTSNALEGGESETQLPDAVGNAADLPMVPEPVAVLEAATDESFPTMSPTDFPTLIISNLGCTQGDAVLTFTALANGETLSDGDRVLPGQKFKGGAQVGGISVEETDGRFDDAILVAPNNNVGDEYLSVGIVDSTGNLAEDGGSILVDFEVPVIVKSLGVESPSTSLAAEVANDPGSVELFDSRRTRLNEVPIPPLVIADTSQTVDMTGGDDEEMMVQRIVIKITGAIVINNVRFRIPCDDENVSIEERQELSPEDEAGLATMVPSSVPSIEESMEPTLADRTAAPTVGATAVDTTIAPTVRDTTLEPSPEVSSAPSEEISEEPTFGPTAEPTMGRSEEPTEAPTPFPTETTGAPSEELSEEPTFEPTERPTGGPTLPEATVEPTDSESSAPSEEVTETPTSSPTTGPSASPSAAPTAEETTFAPTVRDSTVEPSPEESSAPSEESMSEEPTLTPSLGPTLCVEDRRISIDFTQLANGTPLQDGSFLTPDDLFEGNVMIGAISAAATDGEFDDAVIFDFGDFEDLGTVLGVAGTEGPSEGEVTFVFAGDQLATVASIKLYLGMEESAVPGVIQLVGETENILTEEMIPSISVGGNRQEIDLGGIPNVKFLRVMLFGPIVVQEVSFTIPCDNVAVPPPTTQPTVPPSPQPTTLVVPEPTANPAVPLRPSDCRFDDVVVDFNELGNGEPLSDGEQFRISQIFPGYVAIAGIGVAETDGNFNDAIIFDFGDRQNRGNVLAISNAAGEPDMGSLAIYFGRSATVKSVVILSSVANDMPGLIQMLDATLQEVGRVVIPPSEQDVVQKIDLMDVSNVLLLRITILSPFVVDDLEFTVPCDVDGVGDEETASNAPTAAPTFSPTRNPTSPPSLVTTSPTVGESQITTEEPVSSAPSTEPSSLEPTESPTDETPVTSTTEEPTMAPADTIAPTGEETMIPTIDLSLIFVLERENEGLP